METSRVNGHYSPSAETWLKVVELGHHGFPRPLVNLLVHPRPEDEERHPGAFAALPNDHELRVRIVDLLVFGPLRKGWGGAYTLEDLIFKTGFGTGSPPKLSDVEIDAAAIWLSARDESAPSQLEDITPIAESLGVTPEYLLRKV